MFKTVLPNFLYAKNKYFRTFAFYFKGHILATSNLKKINNET